MAGYPQGMIDRPQSFVDLIMTRCYPTWAQPTPADIPTKHRKTYTFLSAFSAAADTAVDALQAAAYCRFPGKAPDDALDELGATYGGLARAIRDTAASYRAYLSRPIDRWYKFGTKLGLLTELAHLGYTSAQVVNWRDLVDAGNAPSTTFGGETKGASFFFVALFWPQPMPITSGAGWNDGTAEWETTDDVWGGFGRSPDDIEEIRRVIAMVKRGRTSCRFILMANDNTFALDANLKPTGNYTVYPMFEDYERARPSYAGPDYYNNRFDSPT